jgi:pentapeptide MXKDX repeat protein
LPHQGFSTVRDTLNCRATLGSLKKNYRSIIDREYSMKLATAYTKNWKVLALIAGLMLSTTLTSCSTASPDATQQGDAMKGDAMKDKGDAMKGDAMKGDAMKDKGGAMKGDAMKDKGGATPTPSTKP